MANKKRRNTFRNRRPSKLPEAKNETNTSEKKSFFTYLKSAFDLKTILQIVAISVSTTALLIAISYNSRREEDEKSSISVQMGIQPTNNLDSNGRHYYYESWYFFINQGSATTKNANIFWFLNNTYIDFNSKPYLMGTTHGADINIIETSTPGFCEMNIKNLPPGVGFFIGVRHRIKKKFVDLVYNKWQKHMFEKEFTNLFLSEINITGEKVSITNEGAYDLENMKNN